jgi:penicillin-binding protein 1B
MYVHTRGFDYGDSVEPEQVLELSFANDQVVKFAVQNRHQQGLLV